MADKAVVDTQGPNIDSILNEQRKFDCPPEFSQASPHQEPGGIRAHLQGIGRRSRQILVAHCQRTALVQEVGQSSGMELPVGEMVCRRPDQSLLQLPRSPRRNLAQEQSRDHLGERAGRSPHPHLPATASRSAEVRQRSESRLGVKKGDRVAIYMGMTPELPVAMLACARIGAPHTVVFGGFSSNALVDRIHDSQADAVITQDGSYRRGARSEIVSRRRRSAEVLPEREARRRLQAHRNRRSTCRRAATTGGTS